MPYDEQMVAPMRAELTRLGVKELKSVADVDAVLGDPQGR
jgi:putative YphP/YqiW family bacilliredoxin